MSDYNKAVIEQHAKAMMTEVLTNTAFADYVNCYVNPLQADLSKIKVRQYNQVTSTGNQANKFIISCNPSPDLVVSVKWLRNAYYGHLRHYDMTDNYAVAVRMDSTVKLTSDKFIADKFGVGSSGRWFNDETAVTTKTPTIATFYECLAKTKYTPKSGAILHIESEAEALFKVIKPFLSKVLP